MDGLRIRGGIPLRGTLSASGSKNAALPILAASLLAEGPVQLRRAPRLRDIETLSQVLAELGMSVRREEPETLTLETINPLCISTSSIHVKRMRASFCVLGPLLAKRGRGVVALPGGCNLGPRPIDLHLRGLAALGATIYVAGGFVDAHARRLRGAQVSLSGPCGPTVTGTMNVMSAATLAEGKTIIDGAACEPEVIDLGNFLIAMGAQIRGLGTSQITIEGVEHLTGVEHSLSADRIETATWLAAAAITRGQITVTGAAPQELTAVLDALRQLGAGVECQGDTITVTGPERLTASDLVAAPYPALPTDVLPLLTSLTTLAQGCSLLRDQVFPQRFAHLPELMKLGSKITSRPGMAEVTGVAQLAGGVISGADLRGTAALVLAALATPGETLIRNPEHLDRGYQQFEARLSSLGADIVRIDSRQNQTAKQTALQS